MKWGGDLVGLGLGGEAGGLAGGRGGELGAAAGVGPEAALRPVVLATREVLERGRVLAALQAVLHPHNFIREFGLGTWQGTKDELDFEHDEQT